MILEPSNTAFDASKMILEHSKRPLIASRKIFEASNTAFYASRKIFEPSNTEFEASRKIIEPSNRPFEASNRPFEILNGGFEPTNPPFHLFNFRLILGERGFGDSPHIFLCWTNPLVATISRHKVTALLLRIHTCYPLIQCLSRDFFGGGESRFTTRWLLPLSDMPWCAPGPAEQGVGAGIVDALFRFRIPR